MQFDGYTSTLQAQFFCLFGWLVLFFSYVNENMIYMKSKKVLYRLKEVISVFQT